MKVLHINTYQHGGAAKACIRLHEGLLAEGINSKLLSLQATHKVDNSYQYYEKKTHYLPTLKQRIINKAKRLLAELHISMGEEKEKEKLDYLAGRPSHFEMFSTLEHDYDISQNELVQEADIIHLHWVASFLDYEALKKINKPIVWTLHDMNPFTGGCHYDGHCGKFTDDCAHCPQLQGTINPDLSAEILKIKKNATDGLDNFYVVALSNWLKEQSQKSIFKKQAHLLIPNGASSINFQPRDKVFSRQLLNLPLDKIIILFVADSIQNARKGYQYLIDALVQLGNSQNLLLCAIGSNTNIAQEQFPCVQLGRIEDERLMSIAYSAADVFVIPSLEDNLPNTVVESLMCGTPVIGFPIGGIIDMVQHEKNGYLCDEISVESLQTTIEKFLENSNIFDRKQIAQNAKEKYNLGVQAKAYIKLYKEILNK